MQIGMIGLGRMGSNIVRRLARENHTAVVYDLNPKTVVTLADRGGNGRIGPERPRPQTRSAAHGVDYASCRRYHRIRGRGAFRVA